MLTIKKLGKSLGGRTLFSQANMTINWGERCALVGPNGAGKTTLFRMILGEDTADEGEVERDEYATVGFLPQETTPVGEETVLDIAMSGQEEMPEVLRTMRGHEKAGTTHEPAYAEAQDKFDAMNGYQLEPKAKRILKGLAFRETDFHRPAREMSGGWVMRAHLAKLLVLEPDLLMLDEPTNHLDLMALWWFQQYLLRYPGALLIISHDRDFMDAVIETVYDIDTEKLVEYRGNYSKYLDEREGRYERQCVLYRNQQKEIERIQEFIDDFRSVASKASQVQSRIKMLDKLEKIDKPQKPRKAIAFKFPQPDRSAQRVLELEKVSQAYGDYKVYEDLNFSLERGEKLVLIGPNGAGKSTLIKILAGTIPINGGKRSMGVNTKIGYFSQQRSEGLNLDNTVLEEVLGADPELREEEARAILGTFLFRRTDVHKKVGVLSGGEKSRLSLVKFLVDPPNLLLMDEPTTHLDLLSVEALVLALKAYTGTLVFISHDVHFIRSLSEKTIHINQGKLTTYAGGYDYYLEKTGAYDKAREAITAE
jgi:ATP-binding cassette, subfamily F, member 3